MSVRAGSIITVAGRSVVSRLQTAGITGQVPIETIREIGNDLVVDKVPTEASFSWSMESWDVSTDMMAMLTGKVGDLTAGDGPGHDDPAHTEYRWENCQMVNIASPWKANTGSQGGNIGAGHLVPSLYPTRLQYRLGVTEWAAMTVELAGGSFYYAQAAPVEETAAGDGATVAFSTSEAARAFRIGGGAGTTFQRVFGVLVNGVIQIPGVDYTESIVGVDTGAPAVTTITFTTPPPVPAAANMPSVRFVYFTNVAKAYPQAVNADTTIKPGAVRGRDIQIWVGTPGAASLLPGVQTVELSATSEGAETREMGDADIIGRDVTGTDVTGTVTFRPKNEAAFFGVLSQVTGVNAAEVFGYFYDNVIPVEIRILNPKNHGQTIKSIYVDKGQFQPPPTPARVNTPTDFAATFNAVDGTFSEFKGGLA